jgi:DNA-binding MarR family transcriptional regulator
MSEAIRRLEMALIEAAPLTAVTDFARIAKRFRLSRNEYFGVSIFRDPAWDMLLDLLVAEDDGKTLSVSALCLGSGVGMTTALRHIDRLAGQGFLLRENDDEDQRRVFVRLSPSKRPLLLQFLADWRRAALSGRLSGRKLGKPSNPRPAKQPNPLALAAESTPNQLFLS